MSLHPQHIAHLKTSALSDEIISERGYHSITDAGLLAHMAPSQQLTPAIGVPVYQLGEYYTLVTRPDTPRETTSDEGKVKQIKYEWPAKTRLVLDMLPRFCGALTDTSIPLWFTEGAKKADALASQAQNVIPININGVWGWMDGKDADGNRYLLPDFRLIALRGRRVVLAFDSDYQVNAHVRMALEEFAKALERRGALVGILQLPHGQQKLGIDDALADGWTFTEVEQAVMWRDQRDATDTPLQVAEVDRLQQENLRLHKRLQWMLAILSHRDLTSGQRITALFTALELWSQQKHAAHQEAVPVRLWKIAQESGQSSDVVGRHIKQLETCGAWKRKQRPVHNTTTGAVRTEVHLAPAPALERPTLIKPPAPKNWGGKRYKACEACGSEEFVAKKTIVCAMCGVIHGETSERAVKLPMPQVAGVEHEAAMDDREQQRREDAAVPHVGGSGKAGDAPGDGLSVPFTNGRRNVGLAVVPQVAARTPPQRSARADLPETTGAPPERWVLEWLGGGWCYVHPCGLATSPYTTPAAARRAIDRGDYRERIVS